jgi:hypothetical protein
MSTRQVRILNAVAEAIALIGSGKFPDEDPFVVASTFAGQDVDDVSAAEVGAAAAVLEARKRAAAALVEARGSDRRSILQMCSRFLRADDRENTTFREAVKRAADSGDREAAMLYLWFADWPL